MYLELGYPDSLKIFIRYGNTSGQTFIPGNTFSPIIVTVGLKSGAWSSTNGLSGTLLTAGLTALQTIALNLRNGLETFTVNNNIVVGTEVPWTSGMF